jgi:hypothetical protein
MSGKWSNDTGHNMQIRRYSSEDVPQILGLVRAVYDENSYEKAVQRFKWQYEQNPKNASQGPIILVLEDGGKIIGSIGAFAQELKLGDGYYPAYWVGDYMVHPDFRQLSHGLNLGKEIAAQPFLLMGFPTKKTLGLWQRAGSTPLCQISEYSKTIKYSRKLKYIYRVLDFLLCKNTNGIQIEEIKQFDERFDRSWEKISKDYKAIQVRDSAFLNWRFFQCPHLKYRAFAAVKNNEILGYIVLRDEIYKKKHIGHIVDIFFDVSKSNILKVLMNAGIAALRRAGCNTIKMVVPSSHKILTDLLQSRSFIVCRQKDSIFKNKTGDNQEDSIIKNPANWHLTNADSDEEFG